MTPLQLKRKRWYSKKYVRYNLLEAVKNREIALWNTDIYRGWIRGIFISQVSAFDYLFDAFNFFEKPYNMYVSNSKYKHIPPFTANLKKRSDETSKWFLNESHKYRYDYDILLDMDYNDVTTWDDFKKEVEMLFIILNRFKVTFRLIPSGTGFQFIIPNPNFLKFTIDEIKRITEEIKNNLKLKYLCMGTIGQTTKVRKCEYSLSGTKVCLPLLEYYDLQHFTYNDVDCNNVLLNVSLFKRGLLTKNIENINSNAFESFLNHIFIEVD